MAELLPWPCSPAPLSPELPRARRSPRPPLSRAPSRAPVFPQPPGRLFLPVAAPCSSTGDRPCASSAATTSPATAPPPLAPGRAASTRLPARASPSPGIASTSPARSASPSIERHRPLPALPATSPSQTRNFYLTCGPCLSAACCYHCCVAIAPRRDASLLHVLLPHIIGIVETNTASNHEDGALNYCLAVNDYFAHVHDYFEDVDCIDYGRGTQQRQNLGVPCPCVAPIHVQIMQTSYVN
ncbi:hypothetical protein BRADI_5g02550v3 [Brachypodium distachyon]|uniref:Uncharacterized protein n=1 Tax=Brachypodium distachyon TaxID=15368 RepID=A0A0Q3E6A1_BRADI|nr:hypothetical protein BRADI_5g02550v3 [Brachypodium distachyon]